MELTEFLLARIAEDEAVARAATPGPWWPNPRPSYTGVWASVEPLGKGRSVGHAKTPLSGEHMARWDPTRALAECDTKRQIVARKPQLGAPDDVRDVWWDLIALLALPYASHPDYDEAWRP